MDKKTNINLKIYFFYIISILIPIFIYLDGKIYLEKTKILPIENILFSVPIPISVFSSLLILLFIFYKKKISFLNINIIKILIFCTIINLAILIFFKNFNLNQIVYFLQFLIPWLGLIIAYNIKNKDYIFKIFFYFLSILLSFQILITAIKGKLILIPDIYFFSVYQNIQYVSTIYVMLTAIVTINLYKNNKIKIIYLNLITFIYTLLTYSLSSIIIYSLFLIACLFFELSKSLNKFKLKILLIFFVPLIIIFNFFINNQINLDKSKFKNKKNYYENFQKFSDIKNFKIPKNIELRILIWKNYYNEIKNNKFILIYGSKNRELDKIYRSAHNLFLDITYKFGIILIFPYILLFLIILKRISYFKSQKEINNFLSLSLIFIISIVENVFKVSLKQPYPGLITFYLIGYYLRKN